MNPCDATAPATVTLLTLDQFQHAAPIAVPTFGVFTVGWAQPTFQFCQHGSTGSGWWFLTPSAGTPLGLVPLVPSVPSEPPPIITIPTTTPPSVLPVLPVTATPEPRAMLLAATWLLLVVLYVLGPRRRSS